MLVPPACRRPGSRSSQAVRCPQRRRWAEGGLRGRDKQQGGIGMIIRCSTVVKCSPLPRHIPVFAAGVLQLLFRPTRSVPPAALLPRPPPTPSSATSTSTAIPFLLLCPLPLHSSHSCPLPLALAPGPPSLFSPTIHSQGTSLVLLPVSLSFHSCYPPPPLALCRLPPLPPLPSSPLLA